MRLVFHASHISRVVRLLHLFPASISCVARLLRLVFCVSSCVTLSALFDLVRLVSPALLVSCILSTLCVSCIHLLRLLCSSRPRCCVLLIPTPLRLHSFNPVNSFKHVKRVNSFKRPYASVLFVLLVLLVSFILPPEQFKHSKYSKRLTHITPLCLHSFKLSNSIHLPPHAFQRVKINFFKLPYTPLTPLS